MQNKIRPNVKESLTLEERSSGGRELLNTCQQLRLGRKKERAAGNRCVVIKSTS